MVSTLAVASIMKPVAPRNRAGMYLTSIPKEKVEIPAHTASNAVAKEMSVGSIPLSMKEGILCRPTVLVASDTALNTITSRHSVVERIASDTVHETSSEAALGAPESPSSESGATAPSGRSPISSGCLRTNMPVSGTTIPIPMTARTIQAISQPPTFMRELGKRDEDQRPEGDSQGHEGDGPAPVDHKPLQHRHRRNQRAGAAQPNEPHDGE